MSIKIFQRKFVRRVGRIKIKVAPLKFKMNRRSVYVIKIIIYLFEMET